MLLPTYNKFLLQDVLDSVTSLYVIINHHSVTLLVSPAKVQSLLLHLNLHIPPIPALNTATLLQDGAAVRRPRPVLVVYYTSFPTNKRSRCPHLGNA